MFNNLIESNSHVTELKRRGSFFLFTSLTYGLLFIVGGVASIYAIDAQLDEPNSEIITMLSPAELPPAPAASGPVSGVQRAPSNSAGYVVRHPPTSSVDDPNRVPATTSTAPNTNPPLPPGTPFVIGLNRAPEAVGPGRGGNGGVGATPEVGHTVINVGTPPQPPPVQKPLPKIVSKGAITSEALLLPKPPYPPLAKQLGIQGKVNVQVLIDEIGKVVSAKAISGNPALMAAAQKAALEARFSPTTLSGQPVKVSGVITYNFLLQ